MSDKIPLKDSTIYGPVSSRRLGRSLGINLTPLGTKVCSFDCIYCQYGETEVKSMEYSLRKAPSVEWVGEILEKRLQKLSEKPDYLTFSGNGEPTLHPEFGKVVEIVRRVRDKHCEAKIALLSNSSRVKEDEIVASINKVDVPIMKLDVGTNEKFEEINRPLDSDLTEVIQGLKNVDNLHLQSLKLRGETGNLGKDLESWIGLVEKLRPEKVQIYSLDRPTRFNLEKVEKGKLEEIKKELASRDVQSQVY